MQGPLETCEPQNGKSNRPNRTNAFAASRPRKGHQSSPERIQKPHGAQNGTPTKRQKQKGTHGQNRRNKTKRQGKKQEKQQQVRGGCGFLLDLSFISSRRKKKKSDETRDVVNPEPKTERTRQKKQDLTSIEFLKALPGRNCEKMRENHRRNHTKNTRTQKESKNKSSLPRIFRKNRPLEEENYAKKRQRTRTRPRKTQKRKNGQHFPLQQREEQAKNYATVPDLYLANAFV